MGFLMACLIVPAVWAQGMGNGTGGGMRAMDPNNIPKIGKISGTVIEAESGKPIPFATVAVQKAGVPPAMRQRFEQMKETLSEAQRTQFEQRMAAAERDTSVVTGMVSDEKGQFLLSEIPLGFYKVKVSFIGYKTIVLKDISLTQQAYEVDLGKIKLGSADVVGDVTVTAERPEVEIGIDRKIFNVDKTMVASNGSAEDVMRTIPTVEVDSEGAVSLRGNQSVTILIDGRPSNLGTMLEQIPATLIERVEIITNPSARFESNGSAGIINIVMKKNKLVGYNAQTSVGAGTNNKYNAGASINYREGKFNYAFNYNFRQMGFDFVSSNFRTNMTKSVATNRDTTFYFDQSTDMYRQFGSHSVTGGIDYFANDRLSFSVQGGYNGRYQDANSDLTYLFKNQSLATVGENLRSTLTDGTNGSLELSGNMTKRFLKAGKEWTMDANYSNGTDNTLNDYTQSGSMSPAGGMLRERATTDVTSRVISARTDFVLPISENLRFETGARASGRIRDNDYIAERYNTNTSTWANNALLSNRFQYTEWVNSAYGSVTGKAGKLGYQAGLRAEWTLANGEQVTTGETFDKSYVDFFPNLSLRQDLGGNQAVNLSYSRRINRPRDQVLNPFTDFTDPLNIRKGNSNLNPEFVNAVEAGYTRFWNKLFITANAFYNNTSGLIGQLITTNGAGIATTSYANLNRATSTGIELIGNVRPIPAANVNLSFNYYKNYLEGVDANGDEFSNDGYSWSARAFAFARLGNGWDIQGFFNYMAPRVGGFGGTGTGSGMMGGMMGGGRGGFMPPATAKSTTAAMKSLDMGIKKTVIKDKFDVNLRLMDLLNSRNFNTTSEGDGFVQVSKNKMDGRGAWLSMTYKFGNFKDTSNKPRRKNGEENSDDFGM